MANKFLRASGGSDTYDGLSFASGWATLAYAFDASNANRVAAGDYLYLCTDGDNPVNLTGSIDMLFGTWPAANTPFVMLGADLSGNARTGLTDRSKITTASRLTEGLIYINNNNLIFCKFKNLEFDGGGSSGANSCVYARDSDGAFDNMFFQNCRFTNAAADGVMVARGYGGDASWIFQHCEIDNNGQGGTGHGINTWVEVRGSVRMHDCNIHDNLECGIRVGYSSHFIKCNIYNNGTDGIDIAQWFYGNPTYVDQCVFFNNSSDGIWMETSSIICRDSIFRNNGGYGINWGNTDLDNIEYYNLLNNCFSNNTAGDVNVNGGVCPGTGHITSDPLFVSETLGSENFALQSNSPCIGAGTNPLGY